MNIVVEGPDNSGKTTLVNFIAPRLGLTVFKNSGPPVSSEEWAQRFSHDPPGYTIYDRHTAVSEPIYGPIIRGVNYADDHPDLIASFYSRPNLFVYCRGRDLDGHIADGERDTAEHLEALEKLHPAICQAYDLWALIHAHVFYRIGDDMHTVLSMVRACQTRHMTRRGPYRIVGGSRGSV